MIISPTTETTVQIRHLCGFKEVFYNLKEKKRASHDREGGKGCRLGRKRDAPCTVRVEKLGIGDL